MEPVIPDKVASFFRANEALARLHVVLADLEERIAAGKLDGGTPLILVEARDLADEVRLALVDPDIGDGFKARVRATIEHLAALRGEMTPRQ
jgi:hypothetical protein